MDTTHDCIALLRLLADSAKQPDPCSSPLSEIADLGHRAVPLLIEALDHDEPIIRRAATDAFSQLATLVGTTLDFQPAVSHLDRTLVTDTDALTRLNAAKAIWHLTGTKRGVPRIAEALSHADVEVRCCAVSLLGLVEADLQDVLRPLIGALGDPNPFVRATAAMVLGDYGAAAVEAVLYLDQILDPDEYTRVTVAHALVCIDTSRTETLAPIFIEALNSNEQVVRLRAAQVLGETPTVGTRALPALVAAIGDEDGSVRLAVLSALENLGPSAAPATPALVQQLMTSTDIIERGMVADTLRAIGTAAECAAPALLNCLQEPGNTTARTLFRLKVATALWHVSGERDHLLATGLEAIWVQDWWLRAKAAKCLGELGAAGSAAVPDLRRLTEDKHQSVRRAASEALERIVPAC